jgi:hypothetical protein
VSTEAATTSVSVGRGILIAASPFVILAIPYLAESFRHGSRLTALAAMLPLGLLAMTFALRTARRAGQGRVKKLLYVAAVADLLLAVGSFAMCVSGVNYVV